MGHRIRLTIRGIVQGVGYRMYAQRIARPLGVSGYVRNSSDGSVELVAEGEGRLLDRLIAWARTGPTGASVESVEVERTDATGEFSGFDVRP
jgi:acylphosphatase